MGIPERHRHGLVPQQLLGVLEAARKVMGVFQQPVGKTIVCNSLQF